MNLFDFYIPEWVFVFLNLLILVFALKKLLWGPVNKVLDKRQAIIEKSMEDAQAAAAGKNDLDRRLAVFEGDMDKRSQEMMKEARTRAGVEYDRIVEEAKNKEKQILTAARIQAGQYRESALNAAQAEIIATAVEMACFLMESRMDEAQNELLVASFLERKGVRA